MSFICNLNKTFIYGITSSILDAVTDDIIQDTRQAGLNRSYMNSYPSRIWDLLNRNLFSVYGENDDIIIRPTLRGAWHLIVIFDKSTNMLVTIMREERFQTVKKDRKNGHHYIAHLAQIFNVNLEKNQQTIFDQESDKTEAQKTVEKICSDLCISMETVKHHAIVLFSAKNEILHSIRCVMINRNFDECESVSWNEYISVNESTVVEQVNKDDIIYNTPNRGLKYTDRAKRKQNLIASVSYNSVESEDTNEAK